MPELGDLLAAAGYSSGDVVPVWTFNNTASAASTVTSSSYQGASSLLITLIPTQEIPDSLDLQVGATWRLEPGSGEEAFAKIRNRTDGEDLSGTERSATSNSEVWSGFSSYTPTTSNGTIRVQAQIKTDPATNSSTVREPTLVLGAKL